jgi:predicted phosphodiesterase
MGVLDKVVAIVAKQGWQVKTMVRLGQLLLLIVMMIVYSILGVLGLTSCLGLVGFFYYKTIPGEIPRLYDNPQRPGTVRCVFISDTHNEHKSIEIPPGDILIHCGDFTYMSREKEITAFNEWLGTLPHKHKLVIAGNHELTFDGDFYSQEWSTWHRKGREEAFGKKAANLLTNATYLLHEEHEVNERKSSLHIFALEKAKWKCSSPLYRRGVFTCICAHHVASLLVLSVSRSLQLSNHAFVSCIEKVEGLKFFGSPFTPPIPGRRMAFNKARGKEMKDAWAAIPSNLDVLITHGPPKSILDRIFAGKHVGCQDMYHRLRKLGRKAPLYHVFGHIHENRGLKRAGETGLKGLGLPTTFINAACVSISKVPRQDGAVVVDITPRNRM